MNSLNDSFHVPQRRGSKVDRAVTRMESGLIAALVCLVLVFTMTNAAAMLPALSFISAQ
jgi:Flp pilus assembly pilin Flp